MNRWSNVLLVLCAIGAFLLPLSGRWLLGTYQSLTGDVQYPTVAEQLTTLQSVPTPPNEIANASWVHPTRTAPSNNMASGAPNPLEDMGRLVLKLAVATIAVLGLCVLSLQLGGSYLTGQHRANSELQVCESLHLSKEASVKLIRVGNQKVVVTHDRQGVRGMVLLPNAFEASIAAAETSQSEERDVSSSHHYHDMGRNRSTEDDDPYSVANLRRRLANSEDHGWDLNQNS